MSIFGRHPEGRRARKPTGADASAPAAARSLIARKLGALAAHPADIEAVQLRDDAARQGSTPIAELPDRTCVHVCGCVRSVTLRPRAGVPALVVELFDGSATMSLIWLGRRRMGGVVPGVYLSAFGRVAIVRGTPTIFNPAYELRPLRGH